MPASGPSFFARLGLAFKVLFDESLASRLVTPADAEPLTLVAAAPVETDPIPGALQLLAILQREGRLVDFLQQNIDTFPDADVGAAARVVHDGCRRTLAKHAKVSAIRSENEGARVTLDAVSADVKLVGNVTGSAPYRGVLRHRGWKVEEMTLPIRVGAHDPTVVAPAEIEL
jgi:hypothetical protein